MKLYKMIKESMFGLTLECDCCNVLPLHTFTVVIVLVINDVDDNNKN